MRQKKIPILMYHSISNMPKGTKMRSLHVHPKKFQFQMWLLKIFGYKALSMSNLKPYLIGKKTGKVVGLTFDDGYKNNFVNALPILTKFGFSATLYAVSNNIGGVNNWDTSIGLPEKKIINANELREWLNHGMEIGSHTINHVNLLKCDDAKAYQEITKSKSELENNFQTKIKNFCYPYGSYNKNIISLVKKAGYESATTTIRGRASIHDDFFALPRIKITHHTLPHLFLIKLFSNYEDKR